MPTPQLNVLQRVGGSIGTAILAVVLQRQLAGAHTLGAAASGYGMAFWWVLGMTAIAVLPCAWLLASERKARRERAGVSAGGENEGGRSEIIDAGTLAEALA